MNEEDTFKKLKGLTELEMDQIRERVYIELVYELEAAGVLNPGAVPISLMRERLDAIFKPYGLNSDRFYDFSDLE